MSKHYWGGGAIFLSFKRRLAGTIGKPGCGAEREAINHPIQGTAADIIKIAMLRLYNALVDGNYQAQMLLQVHDELLLEVPEAEIEVVKALMVDIMSNAFKLDVPLKVEASLGANWLELKE
ncbi:MAG: DNA polymerase [Chloroflexota bacterium]